MQQPSVLSGATAIAAPSALLRPRPETEGFRDARTLGIGWLLLGCKASAGATRTRACLLTRRRLTPRRREDAFSRLSARPARTALNMKGIVLTLAGPGRGSCDARDRVHARAAARRHIEATARRARFGSSCGTNAQSGQCSSLPRPARLPQPWQRDNARRAAVTAALSRPSQGRRHRGRLLTAAAARQFRSRSVSKLT
jgi:hypothetical protein